VDTFFIKCSDLGTLQRLRIWHDNAGLGAAWHCARVEVTPSSGTGAGATVVFPCNK
jgi:hypothetical protein